VRGGFIQFVELPESSFNLLKINELNLTAELVDPNNNATQYALALVYEGVQIDEFISVTSFPSTLNITGKMILDALSLTPADLSLDTEFEFVATVTTPTGVYSALTPNFNRDTNTQEGGNTANPLFSPGEKNAMIFKIRFFIPPPKKLRGTSFETPFAAPTDDADYIRTAGNDDEGELMNNPGERHVMHVAAGNGVDDEIGFKSEFFSNGSGGFSNEEIGVTRKTEDVLSYVDGEQGFQLEDVDGLYRLTFDRVAIPSNLTTTGVQIQAFFRSTSWEDNDTIRIYALVERDGSTETLELLNIFGDGIDELEDKWNLVDSGFIDGVTAYTLIIDSEIDSGSEEFYFDQMLVYVPE